MSWISILFLFGIYGGPLLGAVVGAITVGRRPTGLNAAIGGGIAVALCMALLGIFNRNICYSGPIVGAWVAFFIVRRMSKM